MTVGTDGLFELPDMRELYRTIGQNWSLPQAATLPDLAMLGSLLKGLSDAELGDMFVRVLWAATS